MRYFLSITLLTVLCLALSFASAEEAASPSATWRKAFNAEELAALEFALSAANLTIKDMSFEKKYVNDPYRLTTVNRMLDEPMYMAELTHETGVKMHRAAANPPAAIEYMSKLLDLSWSKEMIIAFPSERYQALAFADAFEPGRKDAARATIKAVGDLPEYLQRPIIELLTAAAIADKLVRESLASLTDEERGVLLNVLPHWVSESDEVNLAPEWSEAAEKYKDGNDILKMAAKVDLAKISYATSLLSALVSKVSKQIAQMPQDEAMKFSQKLSAPLAIPTPLGDLVIGGIYEDTYRKDAAICIDLGGSDSWMMPSSRAISAAPGGKTEGRRHISIIIDASGDDRYLPPDKLGIATGVMGIAMLFDLAGDDFYRAGNISGGAGILGAGVLVDSQGEDIYQADCFGLGAGKFGFGLIADGNGNDNYRGARFVEGFGYVKGCGAIADDEGNDIYYAGGKYLHTPLLPTNYQSLSQGFGFGMRYNNASGGFGIIADAAGNDSYVTEVYGQGSSYWFSGGLLVDGGGNDYYISTQYSIGTGIHLSAGALLDRSGNDHYFCKNGVGIGGCHDWATGMLMDLDGDDYYQGAGASIGTGHTNGVGILLDSGKGRDGYSGIGGLTQGDASEVRGTASIGVFIDMGGEDSYSTGLQNGELRVRGVYGVAYDLKD
ncbi:MAG: hypothetical protein Kow00107_01760 [Planctomycetota bacterium]